jgi:glutathione S-transferase
MLALLQIEYETIEAIGGRGQLTAPGLLAANPLGEVPVLVDGDLTLRDSQAILVYLAAAYGPHWLPATPAGLGAVTQWLSFAANEIQNGSRLARAIKQGYPGDFHAARKRARRVLQHVDRHLASGRLWLEGDRPSVADIACYPYLSTPADADIDLADYPAVARWAADVAALPGYISP